MTTPAPPKQLRPSELLTYSTVKIETTLADGRMSTGTGFLFSFLRNGESSVPTIVTNKHVVEGAITGKFVINQMDSQGNRSNKEKILFNIDKFTDGYILHPDPDVDLCIIPIASYLNQVQERKVKPYLFFLDSTIIPTGEQWSQLTPLEEIIMIGYPNGIWDQTNNLPIIRQGITATHPNIDYNGKKEFLIDAAVFPGSSGSPVFIYNEGSYPVPTGLAIGNRVLLVGITYAVHQHTATGEIVIEEIPTHNKPIALSRIPNNLGLVIKSTRLKAFESILQELLSKQVPSQSTKSS